MKPRVTANLLRAIKTMREACDTAEREASSADGPACQRVLHAFAWGFANASSSIETAMASVEDGHIIALMDSQSTPAVGKEG